MNSSIKLTSMKPGSASLFRAKIESLQLCFIHWREEHRSLVMTDMLPGRLAATKVARLPLCHRSLGPYPDIVLISEIRQETPPAPATPGGFSSIELIRDFALAFGITLNTAKLLRGAS